MPENNNSNPFANLYDTNQNQQPEPTTKIEPKDDENLNFEPEPEDETNSPFKKLTDPSVDTAEPEEPEPTHNDFEHEIDALSKIVSELGQGDLPLNDAIDKFNDGMQLSGKLQKPLEQANAKVAKIIDDNNQLTDL